jgi:rhodanese-related sulfurtransferase
LIESSERFTVEDFERLRDEVTVLDVRNAGEREAGAITGSRHLPLAELARRHTELPPDRPIVVYCAGGWRSSVAASLLRTHGHRDVTDLRGGFAAWQTTSRSPRPCTSPGER